MTLLVEQGAIRREKMIISFKVSMTIFEKLAGMPVRRQTACARCGA